MSDQKKTRCERFVDWLLANWRPCAMVVLVVCGYVVKKSAHFTEHEEELLDGLWLALGLGAVFTPNFRRKRMDGAQ
jgi:hypothetical protein